ncbi:MAG: carbohydrate ABC transporter substrate-binding protein [Actinobacteria bacterium]|nr:carbohydrate ABC transporter substrate-binding protein [Actinomycetota bacterium]
MSTENDHNLSPWEKPIDRRSALVKAGGVGAVLALGGLAGASRATAGSSQNAGKVTAFFGQFGGIAEQEGIRKFVFKGFRGDVDPVFAPISNPALFVDRVRAEAKAGKGNIDLLVGLHGDFVTFQNEGLIRGVDDVTKQVKNLPPPLVKIGKLGTSTQFYVPHSTATYVMVANKDVLKYMPKGANIDALTYGQVFAWAKAIRKGTGQNRFGLPASDTGLLHRYLQGFLIPSFTGGFVTGFRSKEAVRAWEYMRQLWQYTHPQSLTYAFMQDPLLSEEVLLGWDHVARLKTALDQRPDDLVAFPVPKGPKARSYMPVLVGLGIPKNAPNPAGAKALIRHMLTIGAQAQILSLTGFFPAAGGRLSKRISPGLLAEAAAVRKQQKAPDAIQALLPIGIGAEGGNFNKIYRDTFTRIVRNNENIQTVLKEQGDLLQAIFDKTGAPCWAPDPSSGKNPCRVR